MSKKIISLLLTLSMLISMFTTVSVNAAVGDEEEIPTQIGTVQSVYVPEKTHFVSHSTKKWVGEDNIDGDITKGCFEEGTENSHGRFGGLWQSMGFSKYVFYNVFGEIPNFGYHCNEGELNDKVEVIGRYATDCKYIRGDVNGTVTIENIKTLLSEAKQGDIIVISPAKKCNRNGKAMIYMSSNEAAVNVYHADWTGSCEVTEDSITYDALAMYHCITLLRSTNYPYPQPIPPMPVEKITVDSTDVSLNESITITWPIVKKAESYTVSYMNANGENIGDSETVTTTLTSHSFTSPGTYKVCITANNQYGSSNVTYSEEIVVHNRNTVTFVDYDGTTISVQKVDYGKNAIAPSVPERIGHKFAGWDNSLENITEPCTITATYEINKYTLKFYDVDGSHLDTQTVEYGNSATPPTNYKIETGYIFSGWHITYDSEGTSYECVDGDMDLYATQCWENENLPILITINSCVLQEDGGTYKTNLTLKNYNLGTTSFKLIATLKTSAGKDVKSAVTQEFTLAANESITIDDSIVYSDFKVDRIEYVAVGIVNNIKTGGAYSKQVSSEITALKTWGAWTDWGTVNLNATSNGSYSPVKTETFNGHTYELYDVYLSWTDAKAYCESQGGYLVAITSLEENNFIKTLIDSGSKNAYFLGGTDAGRNVNSFEWITGESFSYSDWYAGEPNNASGSEDYIEMNKSYGKQWNDVSNNYNGSSVVGFIMEKPNKYDDCETKTQWSYRNKVYSESYDGSWGSPWNKYNTTGWWSGWSGWSNWQTGWVGNSDTCNVQTRTTYRYYYFYCPSCYTRSANWNKYCWCGVYVPEWTWSEIWSPASYDSIANQGGRKTYGNKYYTTWIDGYNTYWEKTQTNVRTEYSYQTRYWVNYYYYWKWGDWSGWYDYNPGGDEVTTRTVYRYRNQVDLSDPSAGIEDTSGKTYTQEGTIPEVEGDLSGKIATVMVYKKTNSDPTEDQLEYVDQITIGEGNTYDFTFIPREEPSAETGDYIVSLGIEGASRLINIDAIKANDITFTVKFSANGTEVGEVQTVVKGESAIAPEAPEIEGYDFVKWSDSITNVQDNIEVYAIYELKDCEITYVDFEEGKVTTQTQKYGTTIVYPELSEITGIKRRYWDAQEKGITTVEGNMIVTTQCENEFYNVKFYDASRNELNEYTQRVEFGKAANVPSIAPTKDNMIFAYWAGDCSTSCITQNVEFNPVFIFAETTKLPESNVIKTNSDGSSVIELSCDTENSEIYYIIHTTEEEDIDILELFENVDEEDAIYEKATLTLMDVEETPEDVEEYEFKEVAQKYTGEITLAPNQTITYVAYSEGKNNSLPVSDEYNNDLLDYVAGVGENTLRQYKNSIEGKIEILVNNDSPSFDSGLFTLCFYDKRGIMIDLIPLNTDIEPGVNKVEFDVDVQDINRYKSESVTAKVIGLLSGENVSPITDVISFELE